MNSDSPVLPGPTQHGALILAGDSFIARQLRRQLDGMEVPVIATTRNPSAVGALRCDVTDPDSVDRTLRECRPRWVFQCSGISDPAASAQACFDLHVQGTIHVLQAVRRHSPEAVVTLFGSAAEYGEVRPEDLPIRESCPANPVSYFGASKLAQTNLARAAAVRDGLRIRVVRPFNVIGPGMGSAFLVPALIRRLRQWRSDSTFTVANGSATRDFVDVRDLTRAVADLAVRFLPEPGEETTFNIATGRQTSVLEVVRALAGLAGVDRVADAGPAASRSGITASCGDSTRLRQATGWSPRHRWEETVREMWESRDSVR